jgi:hypothetical protein
MSRAPAVAQLFPAPVSIVFFVLLATKKSFSSRGNKFRTPRKGFQGREFRNFAVFRRFWPTRGRARRQNSLSLEMRKSAISAKFQKKNRKMIFDVIFFFLLPLLDLVLRDADLAEDLSCRKAHPESQLARGSVLYPTSAFRGKCIVDVFAHTCRMHLRCFSHFLWRRECSANFIHRRFQNYRLTLTRLYMKPPSRETLHGSAKFPTRALALGDRGGPSLSRFLTMVSHPDASTSAYFTNFSANASTRFSVSFEAYRRS